MQTAQIIQNTYLMTLLLVLGVCSCSVEEMDLEEVSIHTATLTTSTCDLNFDGCCSPSEISGYVDDGKLSLDGDMTLCSGQYYNFGIEFRNVSGTSGNYITLNCSGSYISGVNDTDNLTNGNVGIYVRAENVSENVRYIEIKNCVVAGWTTGVKVTKGYKEFDRTTSSAYPAITVTDGDKTYDVFDHRDEPLTAVAEYINLTNVTIIRNRVGLDYQGRQGTIKGFRAYKNRGLGVHIAPHARDVTFDKNGSFSLNIYDNGHKEVPGCVAGIFTTTFCNALNDSLDTFLSGVAIDSAHNITFKNGLVNHNGRHGISIYKNCGEHLSKPKAFHRRSLMDRNINIRNMQVANHTSSTEDGYKISWEMVSSAGVMIGARQGLKLSGQNGCHDIAGYVFTNESTRDHWNDITFGNRTDWHHWDFAGGVTIEGGTINGNSIGVHIADSSGSPANTILTTYLSQKINMWGNKKADVFIGNYQRDASSNKMIADNDTLVGASPVKEVNITGVAASDLVVCTPGTKDHSQGVLNGSCDTESLCIEQFIDPTEECGLR
ncbi:MAG: hypothetical protein QNJ97_18800 [Myxococcota bacterium]|nr:hypothetical protein [Myxococcota bacterium]